MLMWTTTMTMTKPDLRVFEWFLSLCFLTIEDA
jgi:hypothetical protein